VRLFPVEMSPRRTLPARRLFVALLPGNARRASVWALTRALDTPEYHARQLLRRPAPVVYELRREAEAEALQRSLADAGVETVRYTQSDLDRVPEPRVVRALSLLETPAAVDGAPYRLSAPGFIDAVLAGGQHQRVLLSDLRLAVEGEARYPVIDLYGDFESPLRLRANSTNLRGTGVPSYQRSAALARFARWLDDAAPHVRIDRGFRVEVERIEASQHLRGARWRRRRIQAWERWSRQTWVIHGLRRGAASSHETEGDQHQPDRDAPAA
jgi:hypothetical protein